MCNPECVGRTELFHHLAAARCLLATATARFAQMSDGVDHPRLRDARDGLQAADTMVTFAAGGLSGWTRTWLGMAILGAAGWVVAAFIGRSLGLANGWTIAVTLVAVCALMWPVAVLNTALARRANRRRTQRPESAAPVAAEVQDLVRMARLELFAAMRQRSAASRLGHLTGTAAGFEWLRRHDNQLGLLSVADRYLCTVIHSIDIWQRTRPERR